MATNNSSTTLGPMANVTSSECPIAAPLGKDFERVMVALFVIVIVVSLIGNTLVILIVLLNKNMRGTTNMLIVNMSVADLVITILPMTWEVLDITTFKKEWPAGTFLCKGLITCIYISVAASILSIVAVTVDRFLAVVYPMKKIIDRKRLFVMVVVIWICSLAFSSPALYAQSIWVDPSSGKKYCTEIWREPFDNSTSPKHYTVILFTGLYLLPVMTIAVLYSILGRKVWRHRAPGESSSRAERHSLKQKRKVIKMLICVSALFAICWLPGFCVQFLFYFHPYFVRCFTAMPMWVTSFAFFLQYLNSAGNPILYFSFSSAFRRGLKQTFHCFFTVKIDPGMSTPKGSSQYSKNRSNHMLPTIASSNECQATSPLQAIKEQDV